MSFVAKLQREREVLEQLTRLEELRPESSDTTLAP